MFSSQIASSPESVSDHSRPTAAPGPSTLRRQHVRELLTPIDTFHIDVYSAPSLAPGSSGPGGLWESDVGPVHTLTGISPESNDVPERL
jgi:hypothetical protein